MQLEVILREITPTAPDLINLALGAGADLDSCADTVAVGLAADGFDLNPVPGVATFVAEQVRGAVHVVNGDVDVAVVVVVGKSDSSARTHKLNAGSRRRGHVSKRPTSHR